MQSTFTTPLEIEYIDGRNWKITQEFDYYMDGNPEHMTTIELRTAATIQVPAGFVTDFASVPKLFWNILPPTGAYGKAAVIHDYLYRTGGLAGKYTKADCDAIFYDAMGVLGVPNWKRWVMYVAVSLFGKGSFKG